MKAIEDVDLYMSRVSLLFGNGGGQWGWCKDPIPGSNA